MFYDVGQGEGWQRNIMMDGQPPLAVNIRQWYGDSRGHWEGDSLVIDVTNFSPKTDYQGSRENLHLVERWTRTGPDTLAYEVTIEDSTVWTRPWTVRQEFTRQSDRENRIYYEPRCIEGNMGYRASSCTGGQAGTRLCGGTGSRSGDHGSHRSSCQHRSSSSFRPVAVRRFAANCLPARAPAASTRARTRALASSGSTLAAFALAAVWRHRRWDLLW